MPTQITCPQCGVYNAVSDNKCWKCKRPISDNDRTEAEKAAENTKLDEERFNKQSPDEQLSERIVTAKKQGNSINQAALNQAGKRITLTTSYQLANREIFEELDIISAETVYGMNVFRDFFASITDNIGGRSAATQNVLRDARKTTLEELRGEAVLLGADAVIAVNLNYHELTGGGKNGMIMLVATGTAVKTNPLI